ncbi:hypothetical protein D3C72_2455140 [compost metagenome]
MVWLAFWMVWKISKAKIVKRAAATETRIWVLRPASAVCISRSKPMSAPKSAAKNSRKPMMCAGR